MRLLVKNSNIFPLPGNPHMIHLGTIGRGLREFVVLLCTQGLSQGQCYIEEVVIQSVNWDEDVFANLKFIQDDELAEELYVFAAENKLTDMKTVSETLISSRRESWLNQKIDSKSFSQR